MSRSHKEIKVISPTASQRQRQQSYQRCSNQPNKPLQPLYLVTTVAHICLFQNLNWTLPDVGKAAFNICHSSVIQIKTCECRISSKVNDRGNY